MIFRKTTRIRFGKAGAHPQLALGIAIAPETLFYHCSLLILKGNCDFSDLLLDFCFISLGSFYLLRKCGLLAHTSAAFLKNCCTEKLFILPAARFFAVDIDDFIHPITNTERKILHENMERI